MARIPFDINFKYEIKLLTPVSVANRNGLNSFELAFWDYIASNDILQVITRLYNDAAENELAKKYIALLQRIPAFKNNIVILTCTLDNNRNGKRRKNRRQIKRNS